jgi:predicted NBD/HSP70 family sugar kinase
MSAPAKYEAPVTSRPEGVLKLLGAYHAHGLARANGWLDTSFEGLTQARAAALTQLSRPTVSTLTKRFLEQGLLLEGHERGLVVDPARALAVGVDIGFSQIRVGISDAHGQLLEKPLDNPVSLGEKADGSIDWIAATARKLRARAEEKGGAGAQLLGVAITIPGPVDRATGKLIRTWHSGGQWRFLSAPERLREELYDWDCHITIDRDANGLAVAESVWGANRGVKNALFVKWSANGVSAAITSDRQIFRGAGVAGEIGHAVVHPRDDDSLCLKKWLKDSPRCEHCNRKGCLASVASLEALRSYVGLENMTVETLLELAREGSEDPNEPAGRARIGVREASRCVGRVLGPVVDILNPELVIVGGRIGAGAYTMISANLHDSIAEGDSTPAIEALETNGAASALTGEDSVRGAVALAVIGHESRLLDSV